MEPMVASFKDFVEVINEWKNEYNLKQNKDYEFKFIFRILNEKQVFIYKEELNGKEE